MSTNKPIPKSQKQLSEESREAYLNQGATPSIDPKRRELQRSVKKDDVKKFSVGLREIDEAIFYYFENVIRPKVSRNGVEINVPVLYGSPERWKAVQKDGFYRDRNGKIVTPLIMVKRDSLEKNRQLGNKLDANNPINFGIFEKKYSRKNVYDRFSRVNNRKEIKEYQGVVIPDFVNITYSCIIFTQYVEQMNKLIETINYASDSYWGDPNKFNFRSMIDSYTTTTQMNQGEDRTVKTTFTISLLGHIVADAINTALQGNMKFASKSRVNFGLEIAGTLEELVARAETPEVESRNRFFDPADTIISQGTGMTQEQIDYVAINNTAFADLVTTNSATYFNRTIVSAPVNFTEAKERFTVYINGTVIPSPYLTITQQGSDILVQVNTSSIGYTLDSGDEVMLVGKFI